MSTEVAPRARVALMIDGENVGTDISPLAFFEAESRGDVLVRRVYGNQLPRWNSMGELALHYVPMGKNSADIALSLDALELALTGQIDCFVIASSDSDFAHVTERLTRFGKEVVGVGMALQTSRFAEACTTYVRAGSPREPLILKLLEVEMLPVIVAFVKARSATSPQGRIDISIFGSREALAAGITRRRAGVRSSPGWLGYVRRFPEVFEVSAEPGAHYVRVRPEAADLYPLPEGVKLATLPTPGFEDRFLTFVRKQSSRGGWFELRRLGGKRARRAKVTKAYGGVKASTTWVQWLEERSALFEFRSDGKAIKPRRNPELVIHQMMPAIAQIQATPTPIAATATAAEPASLA